MLRLLPLLAYALLAAGCFPRASVPDVERERVERDIAGSRRWLEVAVHVGPFFGDDRKLLASDQPFEELDLLESPGGETIRPPPAQRILAPGTPVKIARVEFPTGWIIAKRVVTTPRYHPWAILEVQGEPRPLVLVLPQQVSTAEDVELELDRWLAPSDPSAALRAMPEPQRDAIAKKRLVEDMTAQAVVMAWGHPEKKILDRPARTEEWLWPGGKRRASFRDGKLVRWSPL